MHRRAPRCARPNEAPPLLLRLHRLPPLQLRLPISPSRDQVVVDLEKTLDGTRGMCYSCLATWRCRRIQLGVSKGGGFRTRRLLLLKT